MSTTKRNPLQQAVGKLCHQCVRIGDWNFWINAYNIQLI